LTSIGLRSREVIKVAIACGNGTPSKDLAVALKSPVSGLGKRITKLESDSKKFSASLPLPAQLVGPNGEREVQLATSFVDSFKELNNMS
jgi:hypothetical protein